ncbi:hypothetical protein HK414_06535 [Ramlibacter terrae]|uniref:2-oxoacid dehydrogenase acyltransferase catalytic domain-containing protein n=1 Tax=Ramlibacter terrae TaxID=2732511 RepID=A0ABX6P119_9BURK|nr:hypothetical protein HK414_06535 [Ramlibacter terrae]
MRETVRYREEAWPQLRNLVEGVLRQHRPFTSWGFGEADVTDALAAIRDAQRRLRCAVSFHAFVLHCLARAASDNPGVLTYRRGNRLVTFEDVDVATAIDKRFANGVRLPAVYTVREAQSKSLAQVNWELRHGVRDDQSATDIVKRRHARMRLPAPLRRFVGWRMGRDPFLLRRYYGNIGLTSLQNPASQNLLHVVAPNIYTLTVAMGSIVDRVVLDAEGRPQVRKVACISAGADHAVIDGAALARFAHAFGGLLQSASGLDDAFIEETTRLMKENA